MKIKQHVLPKLLFLPLLLLSSGMLFAQDDEDFYLQFLEEVVEVENPVYKPVISFGTGLMHYMGDIKNPSKNPLLGNFGYKLNVSTFIGKKNNYKLNFFLMYGNLQGHDFDISLAMQSDPDKLPFDNRFTDLRVIYHNSSFRTETYMLGANVEYGFSHIASLNRRFKPYFSIGVSSLIFSPKGNIFFGDDISNPAQFYNFWSDGTIRNIPESAPNSWNARFRSFDNDYETDLVGRDFHGIGKYSTTTAVFPAEFGIDFYLSYRVNLRVSATYFYALSDLIDNYDQRVAELYGTEHNGLNDMFLFTNVSLHFDMFSDPKYLKVDRDFAMLDFDESMYEILFADQDLDGIWDRIDECPDTQVGAEVDSLGCPFDMDGDGIPDIIDLEPNTPSGSIVDKTGSQLTPEMLAEMFTNPNAVRREEVRVAPVLPIWTRNITFEPGKVPNKFKPVDKDGDGYVSFQELLLTIDDFFDDKTTYKLDDIYDLNNFFFSQ